MDITPFTGGRGGSRPKWFHTAVRSACAVSRCPSLPPSKVGLDGAVQPPAPAEAAVLPAGGELPPRAALLLGEPGEGNQ